MGNFKVHSLKELVQKFLHEVATDGPGWQRLCMLNAAQQAAESELEHLFWHYMRKTDSDKWDSVKAQVKCGAFRLDSLLVGGGRKVCVELDGKEFHQDRLKDDMRDAAIIASGMADEVIHIPFPAIYYYARATFAILATWHPWLAIPCEVGCMSIEQAREEWERFRAITDPNHKAEVAGWFERDAYVWLVSSDSMAYAMSFKAWRECHATQAIRRVTKEMRQRNFEPTRNAI